MNNNKKKFGAVLTILGIVGLIYAAMVLISASGGTRTMQTLVVYGILGFIFFIAGISLVRTTKDES